MLLFAVGFNLWLYRLEPTAKLDPNDNNFQFALVYRANQMWDFAKKTGNWFVLIDHWVPNWNEGFNLPFYYSHMPQIVIVFFYRIVSLFAPVSLFTVYHYSIYLLFSLFPLSVFLALRIAGLPWITAGIGALLAS